MPKNLVVCLDGTGNEFGKNTTNVVATCASVLQNNSQQLFYDPGVGTLSQPGSKLSYAKKTAEVWWSKGFGTGLMRNLEEAYKFLADNYEDGDAVFLFGFSRGAFTARALAEMLHKCGLLPKGSANQIPYVTKINLDDENEEVAARFKSTFCRECKPVFVGVWDTVSSLGHVVPLRSFSDTVLNPDVKAGYHAISLDEKRKKFQVSLWDEDAIADGQTIEQVWFAGVHSDVGGYYDEHGLSDITALWMLEKAQAHGLKLHASWRDAFSPNPEGYLHNSRTLVWKIWSPFHRPIPEGSKIHTSVKTRMTNQTLKYCPSLPASSTFVE